MARIKITPQAINKALGQQKDIVGKISQQILDAVAEELKNRIDDNLGDVIYDGDAPWETTTIEVVQTGARTKEVLVSGPDIEFVEFGSGVMNGYGYPGEKPKNIKSLGTYGNWYGSGVGNRRGWFFKQTPLTINTAGGTTAYHDVVIKDQVEYVYDPKKKREVIRKAKDQVVRLENPEYMHTYGNPPNAPIYKATQDVLKDIVSIAKEAVNG